MERLLSEKTAVGWNSATVAANQELNSSGESSDGTISLYLYLQKVASQAVFVILVHLKMNTCCSFSLVG